MLSTSKKSTIIVFVAVIAIVSAALLPSMAYAANDSTKQTRIIRAAGLAFERTEEETIKTPVNLTLTVEPGAVWRRAITFTVLSGELEVNGVKYTITEGKGLVAYNRRTMAVELKGADADGNVVTVNLGGRYFWMWGRLHVARLAGSLETNEAKLGLLLRAAIRPEQ